MENKVRQLIKPGVYIAIGIFISLYLIKKPIEGEDILSLVSYSITVVTIIFTLYINWLWKYNPFEKLPKLKSSYQGIIKYKFNGGGEKNVEIIIKQTLFSIKVITKTDNNRSTSITANIVLENEEYLLYYTYITNPSAGNINTNPIQYGTCRIPIIDTEDIKGIYWTTQQTIGDIELIYDATIKKKMF